MRMYNKVNESIIEKLEQICGEDYVLNDKNQMTDYKKDKTLSLEERVNVQYPEVVVKPANTEEISKIIKLANERRVPVIPRGGGSGLCGGAVSLNGGILLSLERMNQILKINKKSLMAVVQPGVTLEKFYNALGEENLFYPPHPGSYGEATLGGNVGTNAAGERCVRYGPLRQYVKGLEVVLPDGEIVRLGGELLKNNTGYALRQLLIGSEGTLGIVTKIFLRVLPASEEPNILIIPFEDMIKALEMVSNIILNGIVPLGAEFIPKKGIQFIEDHLDEKWPSEKGAGNLIVFVTGDNEEAILSKSEKIMNIAMEKGALDVFLAEQKGEKEKILNMRGELGPAIDAHGGGPTETDIVVPPDKVPECMNKAIDVFDKYQVDAVLFGHIGDGNLHFEPLNTDLQTWNKIKEDLYEMTTNMGGVISGEHGIGVTRKEDLHYNRSEREIDLMRGIKQLFDPKGVLNPGKILPEKEEK